MLPWRQQHFVAVLQVPEKFDRSSPTLVVAPASGSRNAYGALPIIGEWALPRGCALLLLDKAVAAGVATVTHGLDARGRVMPLTEAMWQPHAWRAEQGVAFRHLHDGAGAEADWGCMTVTAVRWAIAMLQSVLPAAHRYQKPVLTVIAAGVSNGGAAVLRAAEADPERLIDAVVAGAPNITPATRQAVKFAEAEPHLVGIAALQQFAEVGLLLPCAVAGHAHLTEAATIQAREHGAWLRQQQILRANNEGELATQAIRHLRKLGLPDSLFALAPITLSLGIYQSLLATYANAAAGSPRPPLCDIHVAPPSGDLDADEFVLQYTDGSGLPPQEWLGRGPLKIAGMPPAQQWRLRQVLHEHPSVQQALARQAATGELGDRPTIIVHGRDDALIAVQHSSRPYYALLQKKEALNVRYMEILHAHHFDAFNGLPGYDCLFVPLHGYVLRALDAIWAHLKETAPLPSSQVVRATRRSVSNGVTEDLSIQHVPGWQDEPAACDRIEWRNGVLYVPE